MDVKRQRYGDDGSTTDDDAYPPMPKYPKNDPSGDDRDDDACPPSSNDLPSGSLVAATGTEGVVATEGCIATDGVISLHAALKKNQVLHEYVVAGAGVPDCTNFIETEQFCKLKEMTSNETNDPILLLGPKGCGKSLTINGVAKCWKSCTIYNFKNFAFNTYL